MKPAEAKQALDKVIAKARVHMYKPIQIAEILHRDRTAGDIDLSSLDTYRNASKKWRDEICIKLTGRASTSSARYQDDLFNDNAVPPSVLAQLGRENRRLGGAVEAYIYERFKQRFSNISAGYSITIDRARELVRTMYAITYTKSGHAKPTKVILRIDRERQKLYRLVENWANPDLGNA